MKKTKILPILLCSCGAISVSSYLLTSCDSGAIAHTDYGKIKGTKHNSIYSFKGVPYADSPTNNLRFAPPHNPKP
jgi:para-nitrobenzyl esterase